MGVTSSTLGRSRAACRPGPRREVRPARVLELFDRLDRHAGRGVALEVGVRPARRHGAVPQLSGGRRVEGGVPLAAEIRCGLLLEAAVGARRSRETRLRRGRRAGSRARGRSGRRKRRRAREEDERPRPQVDVGHQVRARRVEAAVLDARTLSSSPSSPASPFGAFTSSSAAAAGPAPSAVSVASATFDCWVPMVRPSEVRRRRQRVGRSRAAAGWARGGCRSPPGRRAPAPRARSRPGRW